MVKTLLKIITSLLRGSRFCSEPVFSGKSSERPDVIWYGCITLVGVLLDSCSKMNKNLCAHLLVLGILPLVRQKSPKYPTLFGFRAYCHKVFWIDELKMTEESSGARLKNCDGQKFFSEQRDCQFLFRFYNQNVKFKTL